MLLFDFFNYLNNFNSLKTLKEGQEIKQQLCMTRLQSYIMNFLEPIIINTINAQTLKKQNQNLIIFGINKTDISYCLLSNISALL